MSDTTWSVESARAALRNHETPPEHFDPLKASDRDRARYGFPVEPDRETQPVLWDKWERSLSRPWRRIVPEGEVRPARHVRTRLPNANSTSANWSGAVANPPANTVFDTVSATWVVPNAQPPASAWNGNGYNDGHYNALHWVGIDGDGGAGANDVMQAGTGVDVDASGGVITVTPYAWYEWYYSVTNNGFIRLNNLTVTPGDVISISVCALTGNDHGAATIGNVTRAEYVTQAITRPSSALTLSGSTAEWILEREGLGNTYATLANYGAIQFWDCTAGGANFEVNLGSAGAINMTSGATTLSTGLIESATVLECFSGTQQP